MKRHQTNGNWSHSEKGLYFLALWATDMPRKLSTMPYQKRVCALAEFGLINETDNPAQTTSQLVDAYRHVFIDSGVFTLANAEAKKRKASFEEGLKLKLSDIPLGDKYMAAYMNLCHQVKDQVWGFVEIDLGGREEKIKTRQLFHDAGLCPIPVYHPLLDGADYLDYLCERYDRICVSNLVQSSHETRSVLTSFVYDRVMRYPEGKRPYIHYLGVSPGQAHFPHNCLGSCDSSTWAMGRRFGEEKIIIFGQSIPFDSQNADKHYAPKQGGDAGYEKSIRFQMWNWGLHPYEQHYEDVYRSSVAV